MDPIGTWICIFGLIGIVLEMILAGITCLFENARDEEQPMGAPTRPVRHLAPPGYEERREARIRLEMIRMSCLARPNEPPVLRGFNFEPPAVRESDFTIQSHYVLKPVSRWRIAAAWVALLVTWVAIVVWAIW